MSVIKVWVIMSCYIDDIGIEEIFNTEEKAKSKLAQLEAEKKNYHSYWIDVWEVK